MRGRDDGSVSPGSGRESVERVGDEHDEADEAVLAAWRSLPSEHRLVLWQLVVHDEGLGRPAPPRRPSRRGVAAPAERARDRLRLGLLSELVARAEGPECAAARRALAGHLRHLPSGPGTPEAEQHLEVCERCRTAVALLDDVDGAIRSRVAPALLPGAFTTAVVEDGAPPASAATVDSAPSTAPAARVLSMPGRPAALLTAAGALVLAAVMLRLAWAPGGGLTAQAPSPRPPSVATVSVDASPDSDRAAAAASGPRPVIGVAVAESVSGRRGTVSLPAGGSRPDGPAGLRAAFAQRRGASGVGGATVGLRTRPSGVTSPPFAAPPVAPAPVASAPGASATAPATASTTPPAATTTAPPPGPVVPPEGTVTTLVFVPADQGTFVATLAVSQGWLLTSVVDVRGTQAVEHVATPSTEVVDRMHAGRVTVEVTKAAGSAGAGLLSVSFVGPSGSVLPGSGTYALR